MFSNLLQKFLATNLILLIFSCSFAWAKELTRTNRVSSHLSKDEKIMTKVLIEELKSRATLDKEFFKHKTVQEVVLNKRTVVESKGMSAIERQKAKVRAQIENRKNSFHNKHKAPVEKLSGKDKIKAMLERNKKRIGKSQREEEEDIYALARRNERELKQLKNNMDKEIQSWIDEYRSNIKKWAKARVNFLKSLDKVKENLEDLSVTQYKPKKKTIVEKKLINKKITTDIPEGLHFVKGALDVPVRDQGFRPTCSSFAGIRAVEVLMAQNNKKQDLSEQYFYWASKKKCQTQKCSRKGSWVGHGYDHSIKKYSLDIPLENNCPYKRTSQSGNETQIPLSSKCTRGVVKVVDYDYVDDLVTVAQALKNNYPVIASITLSENFYKNTGLVLQSEIPQSFNSKDSHAGGHSVALVGIMKLPKSLWSKEGKVCFLTANSWGEGWGRGGYACLSESWMRKHKRVNPFVILKRVKI